MKKILKTYIVVSASLAVFVGALVFLPRLMQLFAYNPENLTIALSGENIDATSMHEYPFSHTNVGAIPYNRIKMTVSYCNNDPEPATNAQINAQIPRDIYQGTDHYFNAELNAIEIPNGTTVSYYDEDYNPITPSPNSYNVDDRVAQISWLFADQIPANTCDSFTYNLIAYHTVNPGVDITVNNMAAIVSDETQNIWNFSNTVTVRLLTKPLFDIMYGEDNFYKGSLTSALDPDSNWVDPLSDVQVDDTAYHRVYIHNYTYETIAEGITITVDLPLNNATSWTIPAQISASNADSIDDTLTLNLASGANASSIEFVNDSIVLYGDPQGDGGPHYDATSIPSCATNGNQVPCYSFDQTSGQLVVKLPDQHGCSPYVMNVIFATVFAQVSPPTQDFAIIKRVINEQSFYEEGDDVEYQVEITNTGERVIDQMLFLDHFDGDLLNFESMSGKLGATGQDVDLASVIEWGTSGDNVEIRISDLTEHLGDLAQNEKYFLTMHFTVKNVPDEVSTCNLAIADDNLQQKDDQVCIDLVPEVPPGQSNFSINKSVLTTNAYYRSGDTVRFQVVIKNTGDLVIDQMQFKDRWDNAVLEFEKITAKRGNGSTVNLGNVSIFRNLQGTTRQLEIQDLSDHIGNLAVGQSYYITLEYTVRVVTSNITTKNIAIAYDGVREKQDEVSIPIRYIAPPPTDK